MLQDSVRCQYLNCWLFSSGTVGSRLGISFFPPGFSDLQLPEPQIIPAQSWIHKGHKPQLYFYFVIWRDPQRAVIHSESKPAGDWVWTQCKCSCVPPVLKCLSSGSFGWIGSENCPITAPASTLLVWISIRNGEKAKTSHLLAQLPPCGQSWYDKCWWHLKLNKDKKYNLNLISQIFLHLIDSFLCLSSQLLLSQSILKRTAGILVFQCLFLICCFCGWNHIFMNNKSLFFFFFKWNRNSEFRNRLKAKFGY